MEIFAFLEYQYLVVSIGLSSLYATYIGLKGSIHLISQDVLFQKNMDDSSFFHRMEGKS